MHLRCNAMAHDEHDITYQEVERSALDFIENQLIYYPQSPLYQLYEGTKPIGFMQFELQDNGQTLLLHNLEALPRHQGLGRKIVYALPSLFNTINTIKGFALSTAEAYYFWLHIGAEFENTYIPQTDDEFFTEQINGVSFAFTLDVTQLKSTEMRTIEHVK